MTPIQYQKQIRLHEARARLLSDADDVAAVGFAVGYESSGRSSAANTAGCSAFRPGATPRGCGSRPVGAHRGIERVVSTFEPDPSQAASAREVVDQVATSDVPTDSRTSSFRDAHLGAAFGPHLVVDRLRDGDRHAVVGQVAGDDDQLQRVEEGEGVDAVAKLEARVSSPKPFLNRRAARSCWAWLARPG